MSKIFADFETSGLDPDYDVPLEFAMVYTDDDLNILSEKSCLIRFTADEIAEIYGGAHPKVVEMHDANGLWEDLLSGSETVDQLEGFEYWVNETLCQFEQAGCELHKAELAGFNPFFDRKWLEAYAPRAIARLHYRSYDVSTLRTTAGDQFAGQRRPPHSSVPHRALGDCHAAINYARWFRAECMALPE